jgi:drug/metabolite transporter (DMT)-like permease
MALKRGTVALTLLALAAFASNSLLTRFALGANRIDAASFTAVRLMSGAIVLALVVRVRSSGWSVLRGGGVRGALALFAYAAPFSFAYVRIGAAVGALVLFGVVQLTMIGYAVARGERSSWLSWCGAALAACGLAIVTVPAVARPDPVGVLLMAIAGVAWGVYSLTGRNAIDPLIANARSFIWSGAVAMLLLLLTGGIGAAHFSARGLTLAIICGALTSGLGYAIWYRAVPRLSVMQAAVAQLAVPLIAAAAAVSFLNERLTARMLIACVAVVGGIALVLVSRSRQVARAEV